MNQLLTHSRQASFKTCRRQNWFAYELGIRRLFDAKALRMGTAWHTGLEALALKGDIDSAIELVRRHYANEPETVDQYDWQIECETVVRLLCGYVWYWENSGVETVSAEQVFELPLLNPVTDSRSTIFNLAGKIDAIVKLPDGRLAVKENKLIGDDIGPDSDLWRRLRMDHQISLYVIAGRKLGHNVESVLYDATRKPVIKPTAVPVTDDLGAFIVLDNSGNRVRTAKGDWRQTGSEKDGYVLQKRPMTVEEWGEKLIADIQERPEFYYARREIPRLDQDLAEYERELWDLQRVLREAQREDRWYKTVSRNTCDFCPYFGPCSSGFKEGDSLPEGFEKVEDVHPELNRVHSIASQETAAAGSAA